MSIQYNYVVNRISTDGFLEEEDRNLINVFEVNSTFDLTRDRIEIHFYSLDQNLLYSDYNFRFYKVEREGSTSETLVDTVSISPKEDVIRYGFERGDVRVVYNFVRDLTTTSKNRNSFFIESISPDRTEIRGYSTGNSDSQITVFSEEIKTLIDSTPYVQDFVLNLQDNRFIPFVNIGNQIDEGRTYFIFKLYQPLPDDIQVKTQFFIEELLNTSLEYEVLSQPIPTTSEFTYLKGPNFNLDTFTVYNTPSEYKNREEILLSITGSNYKTFVDTAQQSAFISIDHNKYEEFVHFSSAYERLSNFRYKLEKIQSLEESKGLLNTNSSTIISSSILEINSQILDILKTFDSYDRFLFFDSGSYSWPKVSSDFPYRNSDVYGQTSVDFYYSQSVSASYFDMNNPHRLLNAIPVYISDDPANIAFNMFIDMLGQHFDSIWVYTKAMSERYNSDNRLNYGISKDLVSHALSSFGVKLYGSSTNFGTLFEMFVGEFYNTGSEFINTFVTSSNLPVPREEYQKQIFKRLYHNIPLILKGKGTEKSIRALINSFGVPSETLKIRTFGGKNVEERPFIGPFTEWTSSVGKIRIDNTGSIVPGDTLSYYTSIHKDDEVYTYDIHPVEVGFSPAYNINDYLISSSLIPSDFDMDHYIGDPRYRYDRRYSNLESITKQIFSGSFTSRYDLYDFIRSVKFFDNTLFKMIKDFTPARANTATGIIIKSHILERNKIKQVEPKWSLQDKTQPNLSSSLDYTNGQPAYENNFSYYGVIPVGKISGRHGNTFMSGSTSGSYDSFKFEKEYDTRYEFKRRLPVGGFDTVKTHDETKYDGEFAEIVISVDGQTTYKPHNIFVTDGELNRANIFKKTNYKPYYYLIRALKRKDPDVFTPDCSLEGFIACCNLQGVATCGFCQLQGNITCCDLQGTITCCSLEGVITCCDLDGRINCCDLQGVITCCDLQGEINCSA